MDSHEAYESYRREVKRCAEKVDGPMEPSQAALWLKMIVIEALEGTHDDYYTFRDGERFGFSERLVNQLIEFALRRGTDMVFHEKAQKAAFQAGYDQARREVAAALDMRAPE